jgi:protein-disulfide isomerase
MNRRNQVLAIAGFAAVLLVVLIAVSQSGDDDGGGGDVETAVFEGLPQDGQALGRPNAQLTMVEFADLQCPFCADFATNVLPAIVEEYVRPGDLRMEFEPLTFIGPDSVSAAEMAVAVGQQDHLWDFVELFYREQGAENSGYADEEFVTGLAEQIEGVDVDEALDERDSAEVSRVIEEAAAYAESEGIDSTPSFLLGPTGGRLEPLDFGSLEFSEFETAIEDRLAAAEGG